MTSPPPPNSSLPGGLHKETIPASIAAAAEAAPSPTQQPSPERSPATSEQLPPWWASEGDYPRIHRSRSGGRSFSYTAAKRRLPPHPSQPRRRPLLLLHSSQVLNGLLPPPNSSLPWGLQKETTPASITAAAEAATSPTQQPSPERPRHHLRTAPSLVGFRRRLPPASIAAAAEAAASPTQQQGPERPRRHLRTAPSVVGFRRRLPPHPSQLQRRPLLLLHSSQVLNDLAATSEQLPPWWASEGDYPCIHRSRSRGRSFSYTAAKSCTVSCHLRTAPSLVSFRRRLPPHPSQPQRRPLLLLHSSQVLNGHVTTSEQLPPWWVSEGDYPPHLSQPQRRPLLLLHSSKVLNGLDITSEQLPPWWASEGDYPPHPSQPQQRPLLFLHSSQVLNGLPPPLNSSLPGGLQKETTPASIAAAAEATPSPTQQQGPERPRHHLRTAPSLVGFRRRLSPASIAAAAEAAPFPTQQPGPERPPATSEQLPPWWASEGDYPCIHRSCSRGHSFSYTAAKS
ncbi:hypothetical protein NDU88_008143 [Pleurodeles waltl]|uniref:Uncharacterized protein n=1 Tax=Pleurodeles waltl TaxID=8319 RepID=A0AAV7U3L5_PLEWA|nr:hypothetical protein NDU88_008143 [Pleurodeles waltl]